MNKDTKILVVEDSDFQREICIHQLKELGFDNLSSATNGLEAFNILTTSPIDLIISDWEMPEMDGIELLEKTKKDPSLKKIPFLILTVHEDEEANKKVLEMGAIDYIVKPSSPEVLLEKLGYILKGMRKESDRRQLERRESARRKPENERRE